MRGIAKFLTASAAVFSLAGTANAATTVTFTDGGAPLLPGETVFASFDSGPSSYGGVVGGLVQSGSNSQGADPATGTMGDPYLTVIGGATATFLFLSPLSFLGLDYGSADAYNSFTLNFQNGSSETYTGQDIINSGIANGDQGSGRTNGRLTFSNFSSPLLSLVLSSSQNSLEADNFSSIAFATPEPATWAMMILGFFGIGSTIRRRRTALRAA